MALTTTTTADTAIPEVWSALTSDEREENLIIFNMYDRQFDQEQGKKPYDTIHIQGVSNFSTGAVALGVGSSLTYEAGNFAAQIDLLIDTHAYHAFDLETEAEMLTNIPLLEKLAHKSGYAVALKLDDDAAALIDNFGSNLVGSLGVALDENDVLTGMRLLNDAIAPEGERFYVMSPVQQASHYAEERLSNALYASAIGAIGTKGKHFRGFFGDVHGFKWYMTGNVEGTNAAGHDNGMFHRSAVATAVVDNMRKVSAYEIDSDSTKVAIHSLYGLIEVRDDHGVFAKGL
jgi:hypothetical protein